MKRKISLKWFVALSFLFLAALLIVGYSILSIQFYFRGMDRIIADNMAHALKSYIDTTSEKDRQHLNHFSGYLISENWKQMPEEVKSAIEIPQKVGMLSVKMRKKGGIFSPPKKIFFVMKLEYEGNAFYICHVGSRNTAAPLLGQNRKKNLSTLITISFLTALGIFAIIWFLLRQVERPVKALGQWANDLNPEKLYAPRPDFSYPELNELARLIQSSLSSVQESLAREHQFLRHSSHELRTPISVIRNNVELLHKIEETSEAKQAPEKGNGPDIKRRQKKVIDRIDRASLTMKHLTETLLWLSRDTETQLLKSDLNLAHFVQDLAAEANYLLKDKDVEVLMETESFNINIPEAPARIVMGNLIRNAFQHTWRGTVKIVQVKNHIEIINDFFKGNKTHDQDLGFGLGLELSRQLCKKLGWNFSSNLQSNRYEAHVTLDERLQFDKIYSNGKRE